MVITFEPFGIFDAVFTAVLGKTGSNHLKPFARSLLGLLNLRVNMFEAFLSPHLGLFSLIHLSDNQPTSVVKALN